jgi:serine/threonine-protein kinase
MISWSRLLRGNFRDPLLGRDILLGGILAGLLAIDDHLDELVRLGMGQPISQPHSLNWQMLTSVRYSIGQTLDGSIHALLDVMQMLFVFLLLRLLLRKIWLASTVFVVLVGFTFGVPGADYPIVGWIMVALAASVFLFVLVRYGLVAATVGLYIQRSLEGVALTGDFTVWYTPSVLFPAVVALALLAYGFHISLAGQPIFGTGRLLDE